MKVTKGNPNYELVAYAAKIQRKTIGGKTTEKGAGKVEDNRFYITDGKILLLLDFEELEPGMYRIVKQGSDFVFIPAPDITMEGPYNIYEDIKNVTAGLEHGSNYIEFETANKKTEEDYSVNIYKVMNSGVCFNLSYLPKKVLFSFDGVYTGEAKQPLMFVNSAAQYYVMPIKI